MTGFYWHFFVFCALGIFLILMVYRILAIVRMPTHLRWELAPIPHKKPKKRRKDSYPKEYEWWHKKQRKSLTGVVSYMAGEIFLFRGVWKNNRTLWPFSFAMHLGIYMVILSIVFHVLNALFIITGMTGYINDVFKNIAAVIALAGYILGTVGAIGLILKRTLDVDLRNFGSFSVYFRLVFLAAIFISGIITWFYVGDFALTMSVFTRDLFTLNAAITTNTYLAVHLIISLLFILYLPFTPMTHFITKYFTYHAVRWNDEPLNTKMEVGLSELKHQTSTWSAPHIPPGKTWAEIAEKKPNDEKTA